MRGVCGKWQKGKGERRRIGGVCLWGGVYHKAFFYLVFDEVGWVQSVVDMPLSELYGIYLEYQ